ASALLPQALPRLQKSQFLDKAWSGDRAIEPQRQRFVECSVRLPLFCPLLNVFNAVKTGVF
ncbi:MAG: hypothetical protein ACLPOA_18160, partial [Methylocella sp.]